MKAKHSPTTILMKAMEIYLRDENTSLEEIIKEADCEMRLRTVAFAFRNLLSYYGYKIFTDIKDNKIVISSFGVTIYEFEDEFSTYKTSMSLCFNLVCHWGNVVNLLDQVGHMTEKKVIGDTQIALAI